MIYTSNSSRQTKVFGERIAGDVLKAPPKAGAAVLALQGDLGSGKTTFTQGFFKGIGAKRKPISPTFVLIKRTSIKKKRFRNLFHIDAYRIKSPAELSRLGLGDMVRDPKNIILIEWADKVRRLLPKGRITIFFNYGKYPKERRITVK